MLGPLPPSAARECLADGFDFRLESFALCEIGRGWRLICPPINAMLVHFVLQGEGFLECEGQRTQFHAHDIILAPKGHLKILEGAGPVVREVAAPDACAALADGLVSFRAHDGTAEVILACGVLAPRLGGEAIGFAHLSQPLVARLGASLALQAGFAAMLTELTEPGPGAWVLAECLMKQCFVLLIRDQLRRLGSCALMASGADPRLSRVIASMEERPGDPHTLASLAREAGMSRTGFAARFVEYYGETPSRVLQAVRLRTAARMLRLGVLPVKVVASIVGYSSRSQFSRAFKSTYGLDPTAYRSQSSMPEEVQVAHPRKPATVNRGKALAANQATPRVSDPRLPGATASSARARLGNELQ